MGFLGGVLGTNNNYQANLGNTGSAGALDEATAEAQAAKTYQEQFVQALGGQNGIGNQSSVFNQLQGVANGTGPNVGQAQLNQATNQNIQQANALISSQKGINPALAARLAGQQAAQANQQAAGQSATMQAQSQLNALGQLGGIAGQQVSQQQGALNSLNTSAQNLQANALGANQAANQINSGVAQSNANQNAALAGGVIKGAAAAAGGMAEGGMVPEVPSNMSGPSSRLGKFFYGAGSAIPSDSAGQQMGEGMGSIFGTLAKRGVEALQDNSPQADAAMRQAYNNSALLSGQSNVNQPKLNVLPQQQAGPSLGANMQLPGAQMPSNIFGVSPAPAMSKGGKVPAKLSPGEIYLPPQKAEKVAKGETDPIKAGKKVPGKAKVKGDSYSNDTVAAMLEAGGVVVPRSVLDSKDPHKAAADFVAAVMAHSRHKKA
jgi:hypothetical protein